MATCISLTVAAQADS